VSYVTLGKFHYKYNDEAVTQMALKVTAWGSRRYNGSIDEEPLLYGDSELSFPTRLTFYNSGFTNA